MYFRDRIIIEHDYISRKIRNVVQIKNFRLYQIWCHYARIYQRGIILKLVVPPNLLEQENVCLIPREAEHPSKKPHTDLQPSR